MSSRPRASDWMNTGSDDEDDLENRYSDEEDLKTSRISRPTKRRRLASQDQNSSDEEDVISSEEDVPIGSSTTTGDKKITGRDGIPKGSSKTQSRQQEEDEDFSDDFLTAEEHDGDNQEDDDDEDEAERGLPDISIPLSTSSKQPKQPKIKSIKSTTALTAQSTSLSKTGVCYLSRIPPFMKPTKLRHLLSQFGPVNRIFLSPESPQSYAKRVRFGGNKKKTYEEGWVEFVDKSTAKFAAKSLNANQIGGKKGDWYYDDVWNIKYLPKFKWRHLTEQIANENAARQARLRAEISQATRENKNYIQNVERAKMVENMEAATKEKKRKASAADDGKVDSNIGKSSEKAEQIQIRRTFKQKTALTKTASKSGEGPPKSDAMKKLLNSVF